MTTNIARIVRTLDGMIDDSKRTVAKFTERLAEDPAYAFEWGDSAMDAAASLAVASRLKAIITAQSAKMTEDELVKAVCDMILQNMVHGAQSPKQSTSTCANLMDRYTTKAYAGLADLFL